MPNPVPHPDCAVCAKEDNGSHIDIFAKDLDALVFNARQFTSDWRATVNPARVKYWRENTDTARWYFEEAIKHLRLAQSNIGVAQAWIPTAANGVIASKVLGFDVSGNNPHVEGTAAAQAGE